MMAAKKRDWTIRKRMILLLIPAIIIVLTIATLFSLQLSSAAQKDVAYDDTLNSARAYAHEFNTELSDDLVKSRTFSSVLDQNTGMTRKEVLEIQHSLLTDNKKAIGIGVIFEPGAFDGQDGRYANTPGHDATGRFAAYWNRLNGTESLIPVVDIETSDWYTIPKSTKKEIVMEPLLYENVLMTSYITPIIKNGTFAGTVGIDIPLENLDRTVSQVKVFDTGYAFLVSNSGIFVSSPKKEYIGRMSLDELSREKNNSNLATMAADIRNGKEGYAAMADPFTGKNVVMFYSPIQTGNWSMVVVAPTDEMLAGVAQLGSVLLLIGLFSILVVGGIIIIVARNLSEPIVAMSRAADRIASGDLDVHVPEHDGELGVLANAFNNMTARLRELIDRLEEKVAELQNTQAALKESEEKYRHLIENSHDIIYTLNTEGILTFVSPSWTTILGHTVSDVVGKPFQQFVHRDDLARCMGYLQTMIETGQRQTGIEYRVRHSDGSWRWHITNAVPLRDASGRITGGEGSASDITERKKADEALHLFKDLVEHSSDAIGMSTPDGRHYYQNEAFNSLFGNIGNNPPDTVYVDKAIGKTVFETIQGGGSWQGEVKMFKADGTVLDIFQRAYAIKDPDGQIIGLVGLHTDITERKKAEDAILKKTEELHTAYDELAAAGEELRAQFDALAENEQRIRESEERFRLLFQNMKAVFSLYEVVLNKNQKPCDYRYLEVNPAYEKITNKSASELIGKTLLEVFPLTEQYWMEKFEEVYVTGISTNFEKYSIELDTYIELNLYTPQKGQLAMISLDITERKRAEETLRLANERFKRYVDANIVGVILASPSGSIIDANDYYLHMIGYTREEFEQGKVNWRILTPPEWLHADEHAIEELRNRGKCTPYEKEYIHKDGTRVAVLLSDAMLPGPEEQIVAFVLDITERKLMETTLLKVNQKLNVLSQLTRKDLTNQIFVLSSYLELTKIQLGEQDQIIEILQKGIQEIRLITQTIEYSKDYQDMGAKPPKWQNVKLTMLLGLSHIPLGNIQNIFETDNLEIFADPLLEKVCQRLFENSVKLGEHVTQIRVWHTATPDGATIFFEDNGIGISVEKKEQIFLRSEGTRASMRSLIFVREILDITDITIKETGEPGKGARFEIIVPKGAWRTSGDGA